MFHFVAQTMRHLKGMLDTINVTYEERIFESEDGIAGLGHELFVSCFQNTIKPCIYMFHMLF